MVAKGHLQQEPAVTVASDDLKIDEILTLNDQVGIGIKYTE